LYTTLGIAPPLISTIHGSPQHPLRIFQPAVSLQAFPWQWLLQRKFFSFPRLGPHSLQCRSQFPHLTQLPNYPGVISSQLFSSESESELLYDWRFTTKQFVLATSPLRLTTSFFQLKTFAYRPYVTSSLAIGWVCRLQLLMALDSADILRSESRRTHDHTYCLRFETSSTWRARSPYLKAPGTGWPSYTPRHWVPFSSLPTTDRATVEVFDPAWSPRYITSGRTQQKIPFPNNPSISACVFVTEGTFLLSCCLTMDVTSGSIILAFSRHITLLFLTTSIVLSFSQIHLSRN
jgi:hypothetical protein